MNTMPNALVHILKEYKPKKIINLAQEEIKINVKYDLVILDENKNQYNQLMNVFNNVESAGFLFGINWNKDQLMIRAAAAELGCMIADNLEPNVWVIRKK
jgi:hypothetical protein